MKYHIILFIFALIITSCGTNRMIYRQMNGKPLDALTGEFGEPNTILDEGNEKIYVYEITKNLKSTEIGQGQLTLDPMVTPRVRKTEIYYFTVVNGIVTSSKLDEEYKRMP